jgi:hypothetical protein
MRRRLARGGYRSRYRLRKQTFEPVFGQIKQARGFWQFLLRGLDKTSGEWKSDLHSSQPPEACRRTFPRKRRVMIHLG